MRRKSANAGAMEPFIFVDIFCGAGGLSLGAKFAGFKLGAALDKDPRACGTYKANFPEVRILCTDIEDVSASDILSVIPEGRVDVLAAGPSCQGFSTHGKRNPQDERNFLFKEFMRLVKDLRPPWVIMENVKGLLTYHQGSYRNMICEAFAKISYRVEARVLNAADYGVPQRRERILFVATNTDEDIRFPSPTHCPTEQAGILGLKPYVSVEEAIGDLPELGESGCSESYACPPSTSFQRYARKGSRVLTLHFAKHVSDRAMAIIRRIPPGHGIRYLPPDSLPKRFHRMRKIKSGAFRRDCTTLYYRLSREHPAYTITCYFTNVSSGPFVHPGQNRALTPREAARLQSFPDSYQFVPRKTNHQIGNAVPPLLAKSIASVLIEKLKASSLCMAAAN